MPAFKDLTGQKFGKLTVISRANFNRKTVSVAQIDCKTNEIINIYDEETTDSLDEDNEEW